MPALGQKRRSTDSRSLPIYSDHGHRQTAPAGPVGADFVAKVENRNDAKNLAKVDV
jgi:hypothetical protein